MRIGIDLLWVRVGICGGTESYVRNLLDGFSQYDSRNTFILFVAEDNAESFKKYEQFDNFSIIICNTDSSVQWKRILWENLFLDRMASRNMVDRMFIPVYSMPRIWGSHIPYICVIHDLQALHFPQYFSHARRIFLESKWRYACAKADTVIATTDYTKTDIINHYSKAYNKTEVIGIPIIYSGSDIDFKIIGDKYNISQDGYYYCVSSMLPHKNLNTILKVLSEMKKSGLKRIFVVSGVGGNEDEFDRMLRELNIEDSVVKTGFISNDERDCLYKNCRVFLFPSLFEGFGMPPIEAMMQGKITITTRETSLEEVTGGKAVYVDDPYSVDEWMMKIKMAENQKGTKIEFPQYDINNIIECYDRVFER